MAIFGNNSKKGGVKKASGERATASRAAKLSDGREHMIIQAPWLSEKALIGTENGVYVFKVPADATKPQISGAIETIYNVTPRQIRIVNLPAKRKSLRTRAGYGTRAARHKAYVYLKKGDSIQF